MSHDSLKQMPSNAQPQSADLQRRVLVFSGLGLLVVVVALALFGPMGMPDARLAAEHLLSQARIGGAPVSWGQVPALTLAGLAAGLLAGMLGMGGGVLKVTCMLLIFSFDIFFSRAISIVTMSFSSSSALWHYVRARQVVWSTAIPMALLAVPGAIVGILVGNSMRGATLTHIFGVFLVFLSFNTLALTFDDPDDRRMEQAFNNARPGDGTRYRAGAIGALHGTICGLLGISGGVIATPLQQLLLHVPTRSAIANTLLVSAVVTGFGSTFVVWSGVSRGDFRLSQVAFVSLFMGGAAIVGARVGAQLGERCNVAFLRLLFVALTFGAGLTILF